VPLSKGKGGKQGIIPRRGRHRGRLLTARSEKEKHLTSSITPFDERKQEREGSSPRSSINLSFSIPFRGGKRVAPFTFSSGKGGGGDEVKRSAKKIFNYWEKKQKKAGHRGGGSAPL